MVGAELAAGPVMPLGPSRLYSQRLRHAIRPADTGTSVVFPVTALRDGVLNEAVRAPCGQGVIPQLRHHIGLLALLLCHRHDRRVVLAVVPSDAGAHTPVLVSLVGAVASLARG